MTNVTPPPPTPTQPYKAVVAGVLAFLGALLIELRGRENLESMTTMEWLIIIIAAIVTAGATWAVPNPPKAAGRRYR